jgi:hypothetical protein
MESRLFFPEIFLIWNNLDILAGDREIETSSTSIDWEQLNRSIVWGKAAHYHIFGIEATGFIFDPAFGDLQKRELRVYNSPTSKLMHFSANRRVDSYFVDNLSYPWLFRNQCEISSQRFSLRALDRNSTFKVEEHSLHQHWCTCSIAWPVRWNPQHWSLLTVVSATSAPPFQPFRRQRNVCCQCVSFSGPDWWKSLRAKFGL